MIVEAVLVALMKVLARVNKGSKNRWYIDHLPMMAYQHHKNIKAGNLQN
jgi:hypothetical protein